MMWCDDCGDQVTIAKSLLVIYPNGKTKKSLKDLMELAQKFGFDVLEILICPECWDRNFKTSRKKFVASLIRILTEE